MKNYIIINKLNNLEIPHLLVTSDEKNALSIAKTMVPKNVNIKIQEISKEEIIQRNKINLSVVKKNEKIEAQKILIAISALEKTDTNENYSVEKAKYQKIINDNLL